MHEKKWSYEETRLYIKSDAKSHIKKAIDKSMEARNRLERFIARKPEFRTSLIPLTLDKENYSGIIRMMLKASEIAKVGPFASVAGSISQIANENGIQSKSDNMLVDNGGDISLTGTKNFLVGIYAGDSPASGKFAFSIDPKNLPIGICTSSGSFGHSISFGDADAVTVVADEACVADAIATAVANKVEGDDIELSIKSGLDRADDFSEPSGCLVVREGKIGVTGKLPKILSLPKEVKASPKHLSGDHALIE